MPRNATRTRSTSLPLLRPAAVLAALLVAGCAACGGSRAPAPVAGTTPPATGGAPTAPTAIAGVQVQMDFTGSSGFYGRPFPDESRRRPDGSIDLTGFPNPGDNSFARTLLGIIARDARGFGSTTAIYLQTTAALRTPAYLTPHHTTTRLSPVFLLDIDPLSPTYLDRTPVIVQALADGGPYGAPNLLALLPYQGTPLRPETLYAAVVLRGLGDTNGQLLGVSQSMAELAARVQPAGLPGSAFQSYRTALDALDTDGVDLRAIAGLAVFRTDAPTRELDEFLQAARARPLPRPLQAWTITAAFPEYTVLQNTVRMPVYQGGTPPFLTGGGGWQRDAAGQPVLQREEEANLFLTVPRRPMPPGGFPTTVFIRTGLGTGAMPMVDRGVHPAAGAPAVPGTGLALELARAGFCGVQIDGPHGGKRNVLHFDEQFLMFNVLNPLAMRDNIRQSAMEIALLADMLPGLTPPGALCPGTGLASGQPLRLDLGRVALFGHSMGATIAPLTLAIQPTFRAAVLSGAGASWIENILYKQSPAPVRPIAEGIVGYAPLRSLERHDPVLTLLQWAGEPADPQVYCRLVTKEPRLGSPRHVLMLQGITDTYILPRIANAMSLALGLDLAGPALDASLPALPWFTPLESVLDLGGGRRISLPASGNRVGPSGTRTTAVVCQHPEDGIEDGHEVVFQTAAPKRQLEEFLRSFAQGTPRVP